MPLDQGLKCEIILTDSQYEIRNGKDDQRPSIFSPGSAATKHMPMVSRKTPDQPSQHMISPSIIKPSRFPKSTEPPIMTGILWVAFTPTVQLVEFELDLQICIWKCVDTHYQIHKS